MIQGGYYENRPSKMQECMEYREAKDYSNMQSIIEAFPGLKGTNQHHNFGASINGIVIRSANDDNVHKAIKYGIWTTTQKNKAKLEQLWQRNLVQKSQTFMFFSVVKSGMFEGVARLASGFHEETFPFWWENHTLKFKGYFNIEWIYIKDINNKHFDGLYNMDGEEVIKSKDCDILDLETTTKMLKIYDSRPLKRFIFNDFAYMDERERNYVRKMYEMTNKAPNNGYYYYYDYRQAMMGQPLTSMSAVHQPQGIQMPTQMNLPNQMMKPGAMDSKNGSNGSSLGFQMNPVSKNKKK